MPAQGNGAKPPMNQIHVSHPAGREAHVIRVVTDEDDIGMSPAEKPPRK